MIRGFDYTVLIVENLDRSLDFYVGVLGLSLNHRHKEFAQLRTGATRLALYTRGAMQRTLRRELRPSDPEAPGFEIGFIVDDVDAAYRAFVEAGATPEMEPTDRFWGQRTGYLRDPDGHLVEIVQNLDAPS